MKHAAAFLSQKQDWTTPQAFFDHWDDKYGFELDAAASFENRKCDRYFDEDDDALAQRWAHEICQVHGIIYPIARGLRHEPDQDMHEMRDGEACNDGVLCGEEGQVQPVGSHVLVSGLPQGEGKAEAGGKAIGPYRKAEAPGGKASLCPERKGPGVEAAHQRDGQSPAPTTPTQRQMGLDDRGLGGNKTSVGTQVRVLRNDNQGAPSGPLHSPRTSRVHGHASGEHHPGMSDLQPQEGPPSPEGLPQTGRLCPHCGMALTARPAVVFCNPPYSHGIGTWVRKGYEEAERGATVVMLIPARTETAWWHDYVMHAAEIWLIRGRMRFGGHTINAPFPSCVVVFHRIRAASPEIHTMDRILDKEQVA